MTKCLITCKSLQKSSKCQNFLRVWHLVIFRADQLKKPPCIRIKRYPQFIPLRQIHNIRELCSSDSFKSVEGSVSWVGAFWNDPIGVIRCSRVLAIKSRPAKSVLNFVTWIVQKKSTMSNWAYKKTLSLFCRPYYQQGHLVHISYQPASNRGYITYWWMV